MKACPDCGTQYEDHVPTCIADGATLVVQVSSARLSQVQPAAPAAPPVPVTTGTTNPPTKPRAARSGSGIPLVLLALSLLAVVVVVTAVAVAVASSQLAVGNRPPPEPPRPKVVPLPEPEPVEPVEKPAVEVVLVSEPLGARVYENDQFVCVTPCTILHPPHAPLPRIFVFKADGHRDDVFEMTEAKGPIAVALHRNRSSPAPSAPSGMGPRPTIGRDR